MPGISEDAVYQFKHEIKTFKDEQDKFFRHTHSSSSLLSPKALPTVSRSDRPSVKLAILEQDTIRLTFHNTLKDKTCPIAGNLLSTLLSQYPKFSIKYKVSWYHKMKTLWLRSWDTWFCGKVKKRKALKLHRINSTSSRVLLMRASRKYQSIPEILTYFAEVLIMEGIILFAVPAAAVLRYVIHKVSVVLQHPHLPRCSAYHGRYQYIRGTFTRRYTSIPLILLRKLLCGKLSLF